MDKRKSVILARIIFVAYLATLAYLCFGNPSGMPNIKLTLWGIPTDKLVHFAMFLPFPLLMFLSLKVYPKSRLSLFLYVFLSFMIACAAGAATEFIQGFTPTRVPDLKDFLADVTGCFASSAVTYLIFAHNAKK